MGFQLVDDVLDFIGEENKMGKETMSDLRDRNITLPILLRIAQEPENKRWRRLIEKKEVISREEAQSYR